MQYITPRLFDFKNNNPDSYENNEKNPQQNSTTRYKSIDTKSVVQMIS